MWNGPSLQPPAGITSPSTFTLYQELQKRMSLGEQLMNERTQQEVNSDRASEAPGTLEQRAESQLPSRCVVRGASSLIHSLWVEGRGIKLDSLFTLVTENISDMREKEGNNQRNLWIFLIFTAFSKPIEWLFLEDLEYSVMFQSKQNQLWWSD